MFTFSHKAIPKTIKLVQTIFISAIGVLKVCCVRVETKTGGKGKAAIGKGLWLSKTARSGFWSSWFYIFLSWIAVVAVVTG
jgi:hypothetical protein